MASGRVEDMFCYKCPRCQSNFYTASSANNADCPFCGFFIKSVAAMRRHEERSLVQRNCCLLAGDLMIPAETVDLSSRGVGVRISGKVPFKKDDTLNVVVKDFDMDLKARVVWIENCEDSSVKTGLMFC